ncbi:tail fiber assembly protein [Gilliamella sp. CG16]|uniref:tail fiber assembly protein n=1 Tax=Gilliamella sp. CG16 TaxID=3351503 RepID=UPI003987BD1C
MNYQSQSQKAEFDPTTGFATVSGWTDVYHYSETTREFISATYDFICEGVGLPAYSCSDVPPQPIEGKAIIRKINKWVYVNDFRNQKIYSTETGIESIMQDIGDIPDNYTRLKPESEFDVWDGKKWRLDRDKKHQYEVENATIQKKQMIEEATNQIGYLQDAVDIQMATEQEIKSLADWKKYRVLLNRINTDLAPNITFPEKPNK